MGEDKIVTSGQATIHYLKRHFPGKKVFLLGNALLREEFLQAGVVLEEDNPDVVVTAFDTSLDYGKMCRVCDFVRAGLPYAPEILSHRRSTALPDIWCHPYPVQNISLLKEYLSDLHLQQE